MSGSSHSVDQSVRYPNIRPIKNFEATLISCYSDLTSHFCKTHKYVKSSFTKLTVIQKRVRLSRFALLVKLLYGWSWSKWRCDRRALRVVVKSEAFGRNAYVYRRKSNSKFSSATASDRNAKSSTMSTRALASFVMVTLNGESVW